MTSTLVRIATPCAVLLLPATASAAPSIEPLQGCYDAVSAGQGGTEPVVIDASGFTPGARVDVALDGTVLYAGVAVEQDGTVDGTLPAPFVARGKRAFTVTLTQEGAPEITASARSMVTRLMATIRPHSSRPASHVRFRGSGFTADRPVYVHYVRKGVVRQTVRLVRRPRGACGEIDVRRRQFPFAPAVGRWILQLDQQRRYVRRPSTAYLRLAVDIRARRRP